MVNSSNLCFANLSNPDASVIPTIRIVLGVVLYILVALTIFGNLLVLVAVYREKRLQTVFNYYIVNLAITDVLVALTAMSLYTTDNILGYWPLGQVMCGLWIFFDYGMTFASVFTLVVISLDRFWSVQWSIHYRHHHNKKKAVIFIILVWVVMLIMWLPPCITDRVKNSRPGICKWEPSQNVEFVIIVASIGHHGTCAVQIFCYIKVFLFMRRRVKVVGSSVRPAPSAFEVSEGQNYLSPPTFKSNVNRTLSVVSVNLSTSNDRLTTTDGGQGHVIGSDTTQQVAQAKKLESIDRRERKVFVTLTYIIIGYMICWVPFHIVFDISAIYPNSVPEVIYTITFWMTYINSTINPFLYNFSSNEFRRAFKKILCCKS